MIASTGEESTVSVDRMDDGTIAVVTLNRPDRRNAINQHLCDSLARIFRELQEDSGVRAVILTGRGRSFCAGIDLANPVDAVQQASGGSEGNPVRAMDDFTRPIIGAINGAAVTGGFELALACDILIGSPRARFQDTHCFVGVVPCWGLSQKLSRTVGPVRARLASLTASSIDATTAAEWGLLAKVVEGDGEELLDASVELARAIAGLNGPVVEAYKATLNDGFRMPLGEGLRLEQQRALQQYSSLGQTTIAGRADGALKSKL